MSTLLFASLSTVIVSVASNTTLFPAINSSDEPCGNGAFLSNLMSSADARVIPTPTLTPDPDFVVSESYPKGVLRKYCGSL